MARTASDVAIVGVGATPYYRRGDSWPQSITELAGKAILAACEDAGISVKEIDGFAYYSGAGAGYGDTMDTASFMETLGIPEVTFSAALTSGGGGSAGSIGLARAAIVASDATTVVTVMALQQARQRLGSVFGAVPATPENSFLQPSGLAGPGHLMSVLTRRHMHKYGTRREAFAEVAISTRENALNRPSALKRTPLTLDDYFNARTIADPLCLYDFCLETDGAVAVITTSLDRARDLRQQPVPVIAAAHGGTREWGRAFAWMQATLVTGGNSGIGLGMAHALAAAGADVAVRKTNANRNAEAVDTLCRHGRHAIRVNAVCPGWIRTPLADDLLDNEGCAARTLPRIAAGRRRGQPDDPGGIAVHLASDASRCHTGDDFVIDGGSILS